ncbi:MAG: LiaF domain-containing protein, partial [Gemmatimonadaceae bacterium]
CFCGNTELDFREARIAAGVTVIEVFCLFGNIEMTFPPGVRIDVTGDALAGSFVVHTDPTNVPDPDAPTIRIVGTAYFGNVEARVRYAGERERDARKRIQSA